MRHGPLFTQNKVIIVSGGSRGLGLHLTRAFLDAGNSVATFARSATSAAAELTSSSKGRFLFEAFDAQDQASTRAFVSDVGKRFGHIDVLINNAAVGQDDLLAHCSVEKLQSVIRTNIEAPILLTRLVLKRMLLQKEAGSIINVTSICGSRGYAGLSAYAASKGAMDAFTRALAREVGERGIRVNSIAPGFFESEMSSVLLPEQM